MLSKILFWEATILVLRFLEVVLSDNRMLLGFWYQILMNLYWPKPIWYRQIHDERGEKRRKKQWTEGESETYKTSSKSAAAPTGVARASCICFIFSVCSSTCSMVLSISPMLLYHYHKVKVINSRVSFSCSDRLLFKK